MFFGWKIAFPRSFYSLVEWWWRDVTGRKCLMKGHKWQWSRSDSQYNLIRKISRMHWGSGYTFPKHSTAKGFWKEAFYLKRKGVIWTNKNHFWRGKLSLRSRFQVVKRVMVQINQHFGLLNVAIEPQVEMWEIVTLRFFFPVRFNGQIP